MNKTQDLEKHWNYQTVEFMKKEERWIIKWPVEVGRSHDYAMGSEEADEVLVGCND